MREAAAAGPNIKQKREQRKPTSSRNPHARVRCSRAAKSDLVGLAVAYHAADPQHNIFLGLSTSPKCVKDSFLHDRSAIESYESSNRQGRPPGPYSAAQEASECIPAAFLQSQLQATIKTTNEIFRDIPFTVLTWHNPGLAKQNG